MPILEIILDGIIDSVKTLPFLFIAFLIMEFCEHKVGSKIQRLLSNPDIGVVSGAVLGIVPQCGFSAMAANLYAGGMISIGTLIAIFLSTSDEGLLLLMGEGDIKSAVKLIICKIVIAIIFGYIINTLFKVRPHKDPHDLCKTCGCNENAGILKPALRHTIKIFLFLLLFTILISFAIEFIGEQNLKKLMLGTSVFQPFITGIFGLIPNCASSVILTQLFLSGAVSFGGLLSGLCVNSGVAMILLLKVNRPMKENVLIISITYIIAVLTGFAAQFIL